jgi:hypothetical protein
VSSDTEVCDVCGSTDIVEIKCKVVCQNCGTILRSCADLLLAPHISRIASFTK